MTTWVKTNLNYRIKVKLNKRGMDALRERHEELRLISPSVGPFTEPKTDPDGYASFQMWDLMRDIGHLFTMGLEPPCETKVLIEVEA